MRLIPVLTLLSQLICLNTPALAADSHITLEHTPFIILTDSDCERPLLTSPADRHLEQVTFNGLAYLNYHHDRVVHLVSLQETLNAFPKFLAFLRHPLLQSVQRVANETIHSKKQTAYLRLWPQLFHLEDALRNNTIELIFTNTNFAKPIKVNFSEEPPIRVSSIEISHTGMILFLEMLNHDLVATGETANIILESHQPELAKVIDAPALNVPGLPLGAAVAGILAQIDFIQQSRSEPSIFDLKVAENQASAIFRNGPAAEADDPSAELWPIVKNKIMLNDISSIAKAFAPELQTQLKNSGGGDTIFAIRRRRQRLGEFKIMADQVSRTLSFVVAKSEALEGRRALLFKELGRAAAFYEFALIYFSGDREDFRFLDADLAARALQYSKVNFEYACEILQSILEPNH